MPRFAAYGLFMRYLILGTLLASPAFADPAVIENVSTRQSGDTWRFDVTIRHPDTGWDHYADGWRVLHHPHENEQPFTRSLSGVVVPEGLAQVQIQARCNVDGWNEATTVIDLN